MFYVYEWYVENTNFVFYVGKGTRNRYKETTRRNKIFKIFHSNFKCNVRIIKYFDNEDNAFEYEHERIMELKSQKQAPANLDYGGKGGTNFSWTDEMKQYMSKYNPMKAFEQRERMKKNNPMKNKEVAIKVGEHFKKKVVLNGVVYNSIKEAEILTGRTDSSIIKWCKRGYDDNANPCRYYDEEQKEIPLLKKLHPKSAVSKAVIIDGIKFETVMDGAKYIGCWSETLIRAIKENRKCKGHTCKYDNQQPSRTNIGESSTEGSTTNK